MLVVVCPVLGGERVPDNELLQRVQTCAPCSSSTYSSGNLVTKDIQALGYLAQALPSFDTVRHKAVQRPEEVGSLFGASAEHD